MTQTLEQRIGVLESELRIMAQLATEYAKALDRVAPGERQRALTSMRPMDKQEIIRVLTMP